MVRKKLAVAIAALGALQANVASALGLGEFSLQSALNQPLNAEIRLLNIADLDKSQVLVKMASQADFSKAGVSRDFFLTNIKFNVEVDGNGGGVIRVTTREPVVEPYLNFLVEARWPSGRMLREYTVLLDLPVFSDSDVKPVKAAVSSTPPANVARPSVVSVVPQATRTSPSTTRGSYSEGGLEAGEQYRVKNDDTLWEIALKSRPGTDLTVQQTMVGIQRLNPRAFVNGNINRLKAGSVLRLPTRDEISVSNRQAIGEVANHNRAWKQGEPVDPVTEVQLDATPQDSDNEGSYGDEARLTIASSGDSDTMTSGEGSGSGEGVAVQEALVAAEENLDKTAMENQELQSRLSDMESKLATLQRLLELKDDQLAAMQAEVASRQPGSMDGSPSAADQSSVTPEKPPAPASKGSLLDQLIANPLYTGGAGLLILAIAAVLVMRRRKAEDDPEPMSALDVEAEPVATFDEPPVDEGGLAGEVADKGDEQDTTDQLVAELESEIAADNSASTSVDESPAVETTETESIQSETGDAVTEADIYVAYGRYQQAIDLLRSAAEKEPERADIQLKLIEVYIETRDKPAFQQQFASLQALGDEQSIEQVKEMLSTVDGVSDWLDDRPGAASGFSDADMDAELMADQEEDLSLELDDIELDLDDDVADDLDLDLDLDALDTEPTQELDAASPDDLELDEELSLDEDLMLDDLSLDEGLAQGLSDEIADDKTSQIDMPELEKQLAESNQDGDSDELSLDLTEDLEGDLDLESLANADLDELDTEFGDLEASLDDLESLAEQPESDEILADDAFSAEEVDLDLDELAGDLGGAEDDTIDLESAAAELADDADLKPTVQYSLDDVSEALSTTEEEGQEAFDETTGLVPELDTEATEQSFDDSAVDPDAEEDDFDFLSDTDEVATKLDLARAYIDMGDAEGARDILDEVMDEGSEEQVQEAKVLMEKMD